MLNKEYYKDLLIDSVVDSYSIAINRETNEPCKCTSISCQHCAFNISTSSSINECNRMRKKWANSEYKEPKVDWNKVPVDTPVYLNYDSRKDIPAHFASYDAELDKITVFDDGRTSFTVKYSHVFGAGTIPETTQYLARQVTLAREEDKKNYYHR